MGLSNILESNGFGIAATGMTIVFVALTFISLFIAVLPRILAAFELVLPPVSAPPVALPSPSADDEEIAAVIGFAIHQQSVHTTGQRN